MVALERPSKEQLAEYLEDGSLARRIRQAREIANHRVRPDVARSAAYRLQLQSSKRGLTSAQPGPPPAWAGMPTKGNVKVFALLIAFSDQAPSNAAATVDGKLFGDGDPGEFPYESLRSFYRRSSYELPRECQPEACVSTHSIATGPDSASAGRPASRSAKP